MTLATACGADRHAESQEQATTRPAHTSFDAQKTYPTSGRDTERAATTPDSGHPHAAHLSPKAREAANLRPARGQAKRHGRPPTATTVARPPIPAGARATEKSTPRPSALSKAERAALAKPAGPCPADTKKRHAHGRRVCVPTVRAPYIKDIFAIGAPCEAAMQPIFVARHRKCVHGHIVAD